MEGRVATVKMVSKVAKEREDAMQQNTVQRRMVIREPAAGSKFSLWILEISY